jgi:PilZ domain-containing protein
MRTPDSCNALESRLAQRRTVHYQIQFAYPDYAGEGMTLDVSERGLCMITNREIAPGVQLYARLLLADGSYIDFPSATVKWCQNGQIGLEVSEVEQHDARRLSELLHYLVEQTAMSIPG